AGSIIERQLELASELVTVVIQVGNDFGDATKSFGLNETLDVSKAGSAWAGTRTVTGVRFKVNNVESDYAFADYNTQSVTVPNVGITVDTTGKLALADHKLPLAYG